MLFDFSLRPVEDIIAGGEAFSWYRLTDGFYRLKLGEDYLLNYSDELVSYCKKHYPKMYPGPYVWYDVVRIWEDILEMLPDILQPVPDKLQSVLKLSDTENTAWRDCVYDRIEQEFKKSSSETADIFVEAVEWLSKRYLDTTYLQNNPHIHLWSVGDTVFISWDNSDSKEEGIPIWSAQRGEYSMPKADFLAEVSDFNNRLIAEMGACVRHIAASKNLHARIDLARLQQEQIERAGWLDSALKKPPLSPNFDRVLELLVSIGYGM